ncbi:hypothetical protein BVRB_034890, partial [Beta vulgaris subsp. vulgaris]
MTNDRNILQDYKAIRHISITSSNGQTSPAQGEGTLRLRCSPPITIPGVLYVPGITKTLLATKSFTDQGLKVIIDDQLRIQDSNGNTIITSIEQNGLHYIDDQGSRECHSTISMELAHRRFGHASDERLKHLSKAAEGINITDKERNFCEICAHAKSRKQPFPEERRTKPTRPFEIVSSDIKGPLLVTSKEGFRYFVTFN